VQTSELQDAFDHHIWANEVLLDACEGLSEEQLAGPVLGTYGSILRTLRHLVGSDDWYLFVLSGSTRPRIDEDTMSIPELRAAVGEHAGAWGEVLARGGDPREDFVVQEEGSEWHAPLGIRLTQAVHHGTDHRSQICTGLSALGIEPPEIDVWAFGEHQGRVFDVPTAP
jgi:uncharacterized damage-inducible protein DinB